LIVGVETSREFHMRIMRDADYLSGALDVQWLERKLDDIMAPQQNAQLARAAAVAAVLLEQERRGVVGSAVKTSESDRAGVSAHEGWPRSQWGGPGFRENA
jgi:acetyl-CoA carboxylase biotin carboxylase subunit